MKQQNMYLNNDLPFLETKAESLKVRYWDQGTATRICCDGGLAVISICTRELRERK
jgi:hypothetical protein